MPKQVKIKKLESPRRDVDPRTGIGHREEIPDVAPDGTGGARPVPDLPPTR